MRTPNGLAEILELYGDPAPFIHNDGTISPLWEARMTKVTLPGPLPLGWRPEVTVTTARVNQAIAADLDQVLRALAQHDLWKYLVTYDGGYVWRPQRGSRKLSMHGFGGALDFNADTNELGHEGDMNADVIECFEAYGWQWGGHWSRPDPMHFQFAKGY